MTNCTYLSVGAVAQLFGCRTWQIRRLFERGLLPQAPRVGCYRIIAADDLPNIEKALREAGYKHREEQGDAKE